MLAIGKSKNNPVALAQYLDCIRTNDDMIEPPRFLPPPIAKYDYRHSNFNNQNQNSPIINQADQNNSFNKKRFYYDSVSGRSLPVPSTNTNANANDGMKKKGRKEIPEFCEYETDTGK